MLVMNCIICGKVSYDTYMGEPYCGDNECADAILEANEVIDREEE
jgi:hypothetical protein